MKNKRVYLLIITLLVILANIAADQITKEIARNTLPGKGAIQVVGDVFILVYAENEGGFLSLGSSMAPSARKILLTYLPVLIMAGMLIYLFYMVATRKENEAENKMPLRQLICIAVILGGGISNLIDRFAYNGHVTDFMNFGIGGLRTGILNVADLSITFGAILMLLLSPSTKKAKTKDSEPS
ncbi:MAG: signal peptidase II [Fibrobacteres bacterium]|nr:signal peptidase II [Fibrobacterota bacterium]